MWFRRGRERRAAWARFSALADQIGARDGQLIKEIYEGGLVVPDGLALVTIRPGSPGQVAQVLIDATVAVGYTVPPDPLCTSRCTFTSPQHLPMVSIETFPAGSTFRTIDTVIPDGHTGVVVAIG